MFSLCTVLLEEFANALEATNDAGNNHGHRSGMYFRSLDEANNEEGQREASQTSESLTVFTMPLAAVAPSGPPAASRILAHTYLAAH